MNSREKGKRGERRWRDVLRDAGFQKAHRGVQYSGSPDSPDVACPELRGIHFEVKAVETLNIWHAMVQSIATLVTRDRAPAITSRTTRHHRRNQHGAGWFFSGTTPVLSTTFSQVVLRLVQHLVLSSSKEEGGGRRSLRSSPPPSFGGQTDKPRAPSHKP